MATRRFKLSPGESKVDVVDEVGAATNSDVVELTIDLAALVNEGGSTRPITRDEAIRCVEEIKNRIVEMNWPPA